MKRIVEWLRGNPFGGSQQDPLIEYRSRAIEAAQLSSVELSMLGWSEEAVQCAALIKERIRNIEV